MNINIYYGIAHIGVLYSLLFTNYAVIKYIHIKKNMDIFLEFGIMLIGVFFSILPTIGVIGSDFIIKHQYSSFNDVLPATIALVVCWLLGFIFLLTTSNYYIKVEEDRIIIHSIWFSKTIISKNQIEKKESFVVMTDKTFFDTYYIFHYNGKYIRIAFDGFTHTMKNRKFIEFYVSITTRVVSKKDEYKFFKNNHDIISAGSLFVNSKRIN